MQVFEVYKVTHRESGRLYIGFTGAGADVRWTQHVQDASKYQACRYLAHAIKFYGPEAFDLEVVFSTAVREEATSKEKELIAEWRTLSHENGFNICPGGEGRTSKFCKSGRHLMAEVRKIKGECHPCWLERERTKRQSKDPDKRERENQQARERRAKNYADPVKREAQRLYSQKKYAEYSAQPGFAEKKSRWVAARNERTKKRRLEDPEFRARLNENTKRWAARKKGDTCLE